MDTDSDLVENIKACRTCGIHYVTPSKHQLKHLFQSSLEHSEIMLIRLELSKWNVEVLENDGYPQYVCNTCIHKFEKVFELRTACINAQKEFRKFYAVQNGNIHNVKIKTEIPEPEEERPICDFIYVDELSDTEYDGATPFNYPHIPIKEEVIEAAAVPMEESEQPTNIVESATRISLPIVLPTSQIPDLTPQNESINVSNSAAVAQEIDNEIECNLCQHLSSTNEEHMQHLQYIHGIGDFECQICGKEFKNSTLSRLKFHMKWHTLNKNIKCNNCAFVCNSKDALRQHKRVNHRKLNCKICHKVILAKKMKSHLQQHELLTKYSCEYCTEAFATENDRENHIWQIHAIEDNNSPTNSLSSFQTECTRTINENLYNMPQDEIMCQEPQADMLYKFLCAHCEHRFVDQIDLETHVSQEHRIKSHLASVGTQAAAYVTESCTKEDAGLSEIEQDFNDQAHINVFEEYDNDEEIHVPCNDDSTLSNTSVLQEELMLDSSSSNFMNQNENMQNNEVETVSKSSTDEDSNGTERGDTSSLSFANSNLNTFACAKCSQTFITIEQLRQHYKQHLAANQQVLQNTIPKSKFQCNFCEKSFDLKFILNRHARKHKHAPI